MGTENLIEVKGISAEERVELRVQHQSAVAFQFFARGEYCRQCGEYPPCRTVRVLDALDAAEQLTKELHAQAIGQLERAEEAEARAEKAETDSALMVAEVEDMEHRIDEYDKLMAEREETIDELETTLSNLRAIFDAVEAEALHQLERLPCSSACLAGIEADPFAHCACGLRHGREALHVILAIMHGFPADLSMDVKQ